MKAKFFFLLALIVVLLSFANCSKDKDKIYEAYFWTSIDSSDHKMTLYIDGANKGTLPYMVVKPNCGDSLALHLRMPLGKYTLEARDETSKVRMGSVIKLKSNGLSVSSSGYTGGTEMSEDGDCLRVRLFE